MTALGSGEGKTSEPIPIVFDTDICGDVDDVLALAMIHAAQSRGVCRLAAVTVTADNPLAAPFVDCVNTFYGRGDVPIGVVGKGGFKAESKYLRLADVRDGDRYRYPHDLIDGADAPPAVSVLRKALAAEKDGSVVVAQVGFSTNLARLLDSPADEVSPLSGLELVKKKVRLLSLMAGAFLPIEGNRHYLEYNVVNDIKACQALASRWPTEVVWSGFEVGIAVPYPAVSILNDFGYVPHHPVAEAYTLYEPPPHNRPTWDLTSVLYGLYPERGYFGLSEPGKVTIEKDGYSRFEATPGGNQRYLTLNELQKPRVTEALVQLVSQPPAGR